jgi:tetratricopeptide (TPR) repeat protein
MTRLLLGVALLASLAQVAKGQDRADDARQAAKKLPNLDALLDGVPEVFEPLNPRSAEARAELAGLELFTEARTLEARHLLREATKQLVLALERNPDQVPVLRRLVRLSLATGQTERAINYGRRVITLDPGDTATLSLLVALYIDRRNDPLAAERLLREVLENPKLGEHSASALVAHRHLGDIYYELLDKPTLAADSYALVVEGCDRPEFVTFTDVDQKRILRDEEADSYLRFGESLRAAGRLDLALRSLKRGLTYDSKHASIPVKIAETELALGKATEALATLEAHLARQPQGREPYELLGQILKALNRSGEFLPRLEAAVKRDAQNLSLQFSLVDQLRAAGRAGEADGLLRSLLDRQSDPRIYGMLTATLIKDRKPRELLHLFRQAMSKSGALESVVPHIDAIAADRSFCEQVLEVGAELVRDEPSILTPEMRSLFALLADKSQSRGPIVKIDRLALQRDRSDENYKILWFDLYKAREYGEAAQTLQELFRERPNARDSRMLVAYAASLVEDGQLDSALDAAREALRLDENDVEARFIIGMGLNRQGKDEEAIAAYRDLIERFPQLEDVERRARASLSALYVEKRDFEKGEAELETLLAKDVDDPGINNDLGYLYAEEGKNLEKAEGMIRKALEMNEDPRSTGSFLDSLGWVLFKRGKAEEAVEPLLKASENPDVNSTIFDHLGDVYFQLQRYEEAEKAWKRAETIARKAKPADKRLQPIRQKLEELKALQASGLPARPGDP